jgi:hypothetical protein
MARVGPALDRHWTRVETVLHSPPRSPDVRAVALARFDALLRNAMESAGIYAVLLPHQASRSVEQQASLVRQREHAAALKASYRAAARTLRRRIEELESKGE